jgi:ABC-type sugar transport system substrate-binding protein
MRATVSLSSAFLVGALTLTACSSSTDADEPSTSGSGFDAASVDAAQEMLATYAAFPSEPDMPALKTTPSSDHSVVMITCPLPTCTDMGAAFEEAAGTLGWQADVLVSDFAPEAYTSAWESALAVNPDGIFYIGMFPNTTVESQLAEAKDAGVWVVQNSPMPGEKIGGDSPLVGAVATEEVYDLYGKVQAAMVIADAQSAEGITYMYSPAQPAFQIQADSFEAAIDEAGGSVEIFEVNMADIATKMPQQVVSYLQRNPDTKYLVSVDDSILPGIPEAISAAGIPAPKLIGAAAPVAESMDWIKGGQVFGSVYNDPITNVWNTVDIMARLSVEEEPATRTPLGVLYAVTKDNADQYPEVFPGVPDAYTTAWGVS